MRHFKQRTRFCICRSELGASYYLCLNDSKPVWPRLSLVALTGLNLFNYLDRQVLPAVLTPIKEELRLSDGNLGMVATAFMLGKRARTRSIMSTKAPGSSFEVAAT